MLFTQLDKPLSQNIHDFIISILPFHALICPFCHHRGYLNKHTYYPRKLRNPDGIVELTVLRVVWKSCGHTHTIMPDNIVSVLFLENSCVDNNRYIYNNLLHIFNHLSTKPDAIEALLKQPSYTAFLSLVKANQ